MSPTSLPSAPAPAPLGVPAFPPLRVRGGRHRLRRAVRRRRRALAAGLAVAAAALTVSGAHGSDRPDPAAAGLAGPGAHGSAAPRPAPTAVELVSAPVRIADAETVRLLRPGDRVDVIAAGTAPSGRVDPARIVASGARVTDVPRPRGPSGGEGALVVLSVPRATAASLAGAGATSRLVVTWC
ncbi:hypothetical protein ACFWXK_05435 [Streptomyces sp. NPDC059070]|uniref:hypothetical protein n=1 Tax=unclassified Streptomyces TaxID=2593676 RepID=UPI0034E2C5BA